MRSVALSSLVLVGGCWSEGWVYAPDAVELVQVDEGTTEVDGVAVLSWDPDEVPADQVSNALRVTVSSSIGERLALEFPDADPGDVTEFRRDAVRNLNGVFVDCGQPRCEAEVAIRVLRSSDRAAELEVTADAILSAPSPIHRTDPSSDAASLELLFVR